MVMTNARRGCTILLALLTCAANVACSARQVRRSTRVASSPGRAADEGALLRALGARLSDSAAGSLLVVRGAFLVRDSVSGGAPATGRVAPVHPMLAAVAASAGALVDPWAGPGSPWESAFAAGTRDPAFSLERERQALIVSLYPPALGRAEASVDVSLRVLRPGQAASASPEVWRYHFVRDAADGEWRFVGRELRVAY
jgi:hypothetical protein